MPEKRQLAAIMFTDIVGYTALMGSDEDKAFEILQKNRDLHNELVPQFNGRIIKEMGDGMLISFNLASDAVKCAVQLQKVSLERDVPLKIGIHQGEVVIDDNDVLGDGVNVASRLQENCKAGCINISARVNSDVKNRPDIATMFLGEKQFKNVDESIRVYQVLTSVKRGSKRSDTKSTRRIFYFLGFISVVIVIAFFTWIYFPADNPDIIDKEKSIAVMPFDNESEDTKNEYFVNGMMEDIRNNLSMIGDLRVISKTSTQKYKATTLSSVEIGNELSVNYLLEGTVQKLGNQIKIHAQLISTENDDHIWQDTYHRDISDIKEVFKIQGEIAQSIAEELKAVITPEEKQLIASIPTENTEAYDLYLKGIYASVSYTVDGFKQGLIFFQKAIELDPDFELAYYGVALSYIWRSSVWGDLSPSEANKIAMPNITRALELNPNLSEVHYLLGFIKFYYNWDFKKAEEEYLKAIKLNANNSLVLGNYANFLNNMERHDEALYWENKLKQVDKTYTPDPTLFWLGRIDEVIQNTKEKLKFISDPSIYSNLSFVLLNSGSYQEAIDAQLKAIEIANRRTPRMLAWLAAAYAKNGQEDIANDLLYELMEIRKESLAGSPSFYIAVIYSAMNETESAFQWLEKAYEDHDMEMVWLKTEPQLYPLHDDPRFQNLVKRVGFPN